MTAQHTAYTYRRSTDGCDKTFDIIHPNCWDIIATRPFGVEEEEQAEADAKLIVHRLNCHERLANAIRNVLDDPDCNLDYERQVLLWAAITEATGEEPVLAA